MNFKLVVASMSLLGLISCPVFAATDTNTASDTATNTATDTATDTTTTTPTKTRHHHKMMRHHRMQHVKHETKAQERLEEKREVKREERREERREEKMHEEKMEAAHVSYKGEAAPVVCTINQATIIMDESTQNWGRALPNPCIPGWFNRVHLSGGANFDFGKWGNDSVMYEGENDQRFSLNDVYLNISADINEWTKAFMSISYNDATSTGGIDSGTYGYSAVYPTNRLNLEQAYATFSNFDVSPFYLQGGKEFVDFSRYEIHAITRSMTQVLSESLRTQAKLGFIVPMGFNGSISVFDDPINKIGKSTSKTNYTIALGYDQPNDQFGWDVGAAYIYNMIAAQDVAHGVTNFTGGGYNSRAGAVALYGDANSGPFSVGARWTAAVQRFNPMDLPKNGFADTTPAPFFGSGVTVDADASGAKPWAAGIQVGYDFEAFACRKNNIYLGYQTSRESSGIGLPKNRWLGGYAVDLFGKSTIAAVEWDHDIGYSVSNGGNGRTTNLVSLRVGVQFG
jgi:hypothetical protein